MGDVASAAAGATPWGAIAQGAAGIGQSILGFIQANKAQKKLENMQSPVYSPNQSILDYYNKALERYNVSPTDSALYKNQQRNITRNTASALYSGNKGNRSLSSILRYANDATLNAETAAEEERNKRFGQLGSATEMKAGEDRTAFDINKMRPYELQFNLLAQKAAGGNQIANAGMQNVFGGLQNYQSMSMLNKMYGTKK